MGEEKQTEEQRGLDLLEYVRTFAKKEKIKSEDDIDALNIEDNSPTLARFTEFAMQIAGVFDE